jgi:hypothetical protein
MNFESFTMPEKLTTLQQIKKLDEERKKLLESAKADALARAEEAINELTALGFDYELCRARPGDSTQNENRTQSVGTRSPSEGDVPDMRIRDQAPA